MPKIYLALTNYTKFKNMILIYKTLMYLYGGICKITQIGTGIKKQPEEVFTYPY
jgi:hypothetical protein